VRREELERLDRDALIARAEAAGVLRARVLTRPELVDELLLRTQDGSRSRGLFGRARDLLTRIVERGLHLPDAVETLRALVPPPTSAPPVAVPTVTLAEIYATQGHRTKAMEMLAKVLEAEPDHAAARALLAELEGTPAGTDPAPAMEEEPAPRPAEPPPRFDECVAFPTEAAIFVYWQARPQTLARARGRGGLVVRAVGIVPTWEGPRSVVMDRAVDGDGGDVVIDDLPRGCVPRVALGWVEGDRFVPIAQSPALEAPRGGDTLIRWTPYGEVPVSEQDADAASIARARLQMMSKG
jgi:hypothetical protein